MIIGPADLVAFERMVSSGSIYLNLVDADRVFEPGVMPAFVRLFVASVDDGFVFDILDRRRRGRKKRILEAGQSDRDYWVDYEAVHGIESNEEVVECK